jgi:hypothetical protein
MEMGVFWGGVRRIHCDQEKNRDTPYHHTSGQPTVLTSPTSAVIDLLGHQGSVTELKGIFFLTQLSEWQKYSCHWVILFPL